MEQQVFTLTAEKERKELEFNIALARKDEEFKAAMDRKEEEFKNKLMKMEEKLMAHQTGLASNDSVEHTLKGSKHEWALALKSKGMPFIKKETNPTSIIAMVSAAICALLAVIMQKTRSVTHLKVVCKVLFESFVFGYHETRLVFHQMVWKYVREEVSKPWKILKAMDMAPKGSLNYRGLETLRQVESLQKWERGFLPGSISIQDKANKMFEVGQTVCPIK